MESVQTICWHVEPSYLSRAFLERHRHKVEYCTLIHMEEAPILVGITDSPVSMDSNMASDVDHLGVVAAVEIRGENHSARRPGRDAGDTDACFSPVVDLHIRKVIEGLLVVAS